MQLQLQNWPLKYLTLGLALAASLIAVLLIALPISNAAIQSMEHQAKSLRNTVSKQASRQAAEAIFSQDLLSLNVILAGLVENPNIRYAAIYNLENKVMAEQGLSDTVQGEPLSIQYQNQVIGLLEIRFDRAPLQQARWQIYALLVIFGLVLAVIASSIGWLIGKHLQTRLEQFSQDIQQIDNPEHPLQSSRLSGFFELVQTLSQIRTKRIQQKRLNCALGQIQTNRFDEHGNVHFQTDGNTVSADHGTILMLNIANFHEQTQHLQADALADLLKQYYYYFNKAARLYSGTLCHYADGGISILFGLDESDSKHRFHGVCTGLLIIGLIKQYNQGRAQQQQPTLDFNLALHEGDVWINRNKQADISVKGDSLVIAAHLCATAQANTLLTSQHILELGKLAPQVITSHNSVIGNMPIDTVYVDNLIPNYQALIERQVQHICIA